MGAEIHLCKNYKTIQDVTELLLLHKISIAILLFIEEMKKLVCVVKEKRPQKSYLYW